MNIYTIICYYRVRISIYIVFGCVFMLKFIDAPFLTAKTVKRIDKIKNNIEKGKYLSPICLIVFATHKEDVFDIIPIINFKIPNYYNNELLVIGVAENKKAAIKLCASLSNEYIKSGSNLSMRDYFYNLVI